MLIPSGDMDFEVRGFRRGDPVLRRRLEGICSSLLAGYNPAMRYDVPEPLEEINRLDPELRGFAYEGAAIAGTILDVLTLSRGRRITALQGSPVGRGYPKLTHLGVGLGLAQLHMPGWGGLRGLDPLQRWMSFDGRGFWGVFFHTAKYLAAGRTGRPAKDLVGQVMDQGVGRALWFVECADISALAERVTTFHPSRHPDIWAGIGLAACYAGGADEAGLARIAELTGPHRAELAAGSTPAARAAVTSGVVPEHTTQAVKAFTGVDIETVAGWESDAITSLGGAASTMADYQRVRELVRRTWSGRGGGA